MTIHNSNANLTVPNFDEAKAEYQPIIHKLIASIDKIKSVKDLLKQEAEDSASSDDPINNDAYIFMLLEVMDYGITHLSSLSDVAFSHSKNETMDEKKLLDDIIRFVDMVENQLTLDD